MKTDLLVVSCGIANMEGLGLDEVDEICSVGDTWLFDLVRSNWLQLANTILDPPRSRAAATIVRDQLVVCGGCEQASTRSLKPGRHLNDVRLLHLALAVTYTADGILHGHTTGPAPTQWVRCTLPTEAPQRVRPPHICASAVALYGGSVLLIFGGLAEQGQTGAAYDQFGDPTYGSRKALALHESQALRTVGDFSATATQPRIGGYKINFSHSGRLLELSRPWTGQMLTRGMPHHATLAHRRGESWRAANGERVLLHGLRADKYNGAIGVIATSRNEMPHGGLADDRLPVQLGPPHDTSLMVRRRNLQPSALLAEPPLLLPLPYSGESHCPTEVWALMPSVPQARGMRLMEELASGISLHRLSLLPTAASPEAEPNVT